MQDDLTNRRAFNDAGSESFPFVSHEWIISTDGITLPIELCN